MTEATALQDPPTPTEAEVAAELRTTDVVDLLKEYEAKLRDVTARSKQLLARQQSPWHGLVPNLAQMHEQDQSKVEAAEVWTWVTKMRPAVNDLIRYASGIVEGAKLHPFAKLEIRLRLAELESLNEYASVLVQKLDRER